MCTKLSGRSPTFNPCLAFATITHIIFITYRHATATLFRLWTMRCGYVEMAYALLYFTSMHDSPSLGYSSKTESRNLASSLSHAVLLPLIQLSTLGASEIRSHTRHCHIQLTISVWWSRDRQSISCSDNLSSSPPVVANKGTYQTP